MSPARLPESYPTDLAINFRAPPPSPVHSGRRSSFADDEVLLEFLDSTRVPEMILPDTIFPRPMTIDSVPVIDLKLSLNVLPAIASDIGCFQVVNHGIPPKLVRAATMAAAAGLFAIPADKRSAMTRSPEVPYGFEDSEEFVWSADEGFNSVMEGICPLGYSNFCQEMEALLRKVEKVGEEVVSMMTKKPLITNRSQRETVCCVYKNRKISSDVDEDGARHEVIRMLIRKNEHSHALCLHLCAHSAQFHLYSNKQWLSFSPHNDALLVTIGDQIQTWSGGQYKHVTGRPIFKEDSVSMAFLYSPPASIKAINSKSMPKMINSEKTISLEKQIIFVIFLTMLYQICTYIYQQF